MSLPETLTLGGLPPAVSISPTLVFNKANYGRYVSNALNLDTPVSISFLHNVKPNGVLSATIKSSEFRNYVSDLAPTGLGNKGTPDPEMGVWLTATAPVGSVNQGYFTQAELASRVKQMCVLLLTGDTIDRFIRGEL